MAARSTCTQNVKMAHEDLDYLYFLFDGGYLDDDTNFNLELNTVMSEVLQIKHVNTKHSTPNKACPNKDSELSMADNLSLKLMEIVKNVLLAIAATDACLPETTRNIFYSFTFSLVEANIMTQCR